MQGKFGKIDTASEEVVPKLGAAAKPRGASLSSSPVRSTCALVHGTSQSRVQSLSQGSGWPLMLCLQ